MRTTQIPEPVPFYPRVTRVGSPFSSQIDPRTAVGFLTAAPRASSTLTTAPFLSDTQPKNMVSMEKIMVSQAVLQNPAGIRDWDPFDHCWRRHLEGMNSGGIGIPTNWLGLAR